MTDFITLNVQRPDEQLFTDSEGMLEAANNWNITTPEMALAAGEDLHKVKALAKDLEERRKAITGPINKALREVNALFRPAKNWLGSAESIIKNQLLEFSNEQDRIAREAQAKIDAAARKEREKLERKARIAETLRLSAKAEELKEEAATKIAPVVESAAPKIEGVSRRETWKAEVTDRGELLEHIVKFRPDLMTLVTIDQAGLNTLARLHKEDLGLPGVEVVKESTIVARG